MELKVGQRIIVLEHWRAHGKIGGWEDWNQEHEIIKINRVTVKTKRILPSANMAIHEISTVRKDRILQ